MSDPHPPPPHGYLHRISHRRIDPPALTGRTPLAEVIEQAFLSYNAGRLREACRLYATKMLADDAVVGLSLRGAGVHLVAGRQLDRDEPGGVTARRVEAGHRHAARREPERGGGLRRQEAGQERGVHPGRWLAEELHPPDRAADPGGAG